MPKCKKIFDQISDTTERITEFYYEKQKENKKEVKDGFRSYKSRPNADVIKIWQGTVQEVVTFCLA